MSESTSEKDPEKNSESVRGDGFRTFIGLGVTLILLTIFANIQLQNASNQARQEGYSQISSTQEMAAPVEGYEWVDNVWSFKVDDDLDCRPDAGACLSMALVSASTCHEAEVVYDIISPASESRRLASRVKLRETSAAYFGFEILEWKSSKWKNVELKTFQCISPTRGSKSIYDNSALFEVSLNVGFPEGFTRVSDRVAYKSKVVTNCLDFFETCWGLEVFSASKCTGISAKFDMLDEQKNVLYSGLQVSRNADIPSGQTKSVQFGTPSRLSEEGLGKIKLRVVSLDCVDAGFIDEAILADQDSRVYLPSEYCKDGLCNSNESLNEATNRVLEWMRQYPSGTSGGSGYTVICRDGWVSQSGGKQGACSSHGGIAR